MQGLSLGTDTNSVELQERRQKNDNQHIAMTELKEIMAEMKNGNALGIAKLTVA